MIISLDVGQTRIVINTDKITWEIIQLLDDEMIQIRKKHSIYTEYPMLEGEDQEAWNDRVLPILQEKNRKQDKESNDAYLTRLLKSDMVRQDFVLDSLKVIAKVFEGQDSKLTEEVIKALPYVKTKGFIKEVLTMCDLPTSGLG